MSIGSYAVFYAERINRELETLRKKRHHLDGLLESERISKSTYDYFAKNLGNEIVERETQQKTFADTITSKLEELEQNTKELELYLAEIELKHVASEIDADLYERESKILTLRIENARHELNNTRTALFKIFPEVMPEAATTEIEEKVKEVEELEEVPAEEMVEASSPEEEAEEPAVKETTTEETTEAAETSAEEQEATEESATETEQKSTKNTKWWDE